MKCSNCREEITDDDCGDGIKFKVGQTICCKNRKKGALHFHDEGQIETLRCNHITGREIRSTNYAEAKCLRSMK